MARIVVEQLFSDPFTDKDSEETATRLDVCLEPRGAMWRRSYLSADRKRMTCEFEAPTVDTVREAYRAAGVPYERAWAADVFAVENDPDRMKKLDALLTRSSSEPRSRSGAV